MLREQNKVPRATSIRNRLSIPEHKFIAWLGIQGKLRTKNKLFLYNIIPDNVCCLYGKEVENHDHLFFDYDFSKKLLQFMLD